MPLVFDENGLQTETLAEIKASWVALFRGMYGDNVDVTNESVLGTVGNLASEREAKLQNALQALNDARDPDTAKGVMLDIIAALTGTTRKDETYSTAEALFKGTPGTIIDNGKQVKLLQTGTLWNVVDGPYELDGLGEAVGLVKADAPGPVQALTTGPDGWQIITTVIGWDTFETTQDAKPGLEVESNEVMRARRYAELFKEGNDIAAIRASVLAVEGVTYVRVFENISLDTDGEGRPGKSGEVLVDGGSDEDIAEAINNVKPPGTEMYGLEPGFVVDAGEENPMLIRWTRPQEIDVWLRITITTTGAEVALPPNALVTIKDAVLAYANANHTMGDNVIPDYFKGTVYQAVGNQKSIVHVLVETSLNGIAYAEVVRPMGSRERADFDSAKIEVVEV